MRVIINDAFCEPPKETIPSATRATLAAAHVTKVMGSEAGWRVWDEAPSGTCQKTTPMNTGNTQVMGNAIPKTIKAPTAPAAPKAVEAPEAATT